MTGFADDTVMRDFAFMKGNSLLLWDFISLSVADER
jgi:hypothetical protein